MLVAAKFIGAGLLLASVFVLVWVGKVQPSEYMVLVTGVLIALGAFARATPIAPPAPPPAIPPSNQEVKS